MSGARIAALPMYDLPELRAATDDWWAALARAFTAEGIGDAPRLLSRDVSPTQAWLSPSLLVGQTCGYPLTHALRGRVGLVATPCYRAEGCEGALYRSAIVVRAEDPATGLDDLRGRRVAFNATDSQSGYNGLRASIAPLAEEGRFFGASVESGAHRESLRMVAARRADVAAIDAVTFALLAECVPDEVAGIRVLAWTDPAPSLPYVTAAVATDDMVARLRAALDRAVADPSAAASREALLLGGFETLPLSAYAVIDDMERAAVDASYPRLA